MSEKIIDDAISRLSDRFFIPFKKKKHAPIAKNTATIASDSTRDIWMCQGLNASASDDISAMVSDANNVRARKNIAITEAIPARADGSRTASSVRPNIFINGMVV